MNAQEHFPVEDLAAYAAGDLDAAAGLAVEAHLVLCADCRSDVDAITNATAALATVERPAMPADVAARLDEALSAERGREPIGTVLPLAPKRRRPSLAGIAVVAAGVALVGAITVPLVNNGAHKSRVDAASGANDAKATRRLASGLDYRRGTLAATLHNALTGITAQEDTALTPVPGVVPGGVQPPSSTPFTTSGKTAGRAAERAEIITMQQDSGRLAACLTALGSGLASNAPAAARVPVLVDFGTFADQPAVIVAFPTVSQGAVRHDRLDVFVSGPQCGVTTGDADVLDFERIPRPAGI